LKENVIVGRLIPAGTGFAYHQARKEAAEKSMNELQAFMTTDSSEVIEEAEDAVVENVIENEGVEA